MVGSLFVGPTLNWRGFQYITLSPITTLHEKFLYSEIFIMPNKFVFFFSPFLLFSKIFFFLKKRLKDLNKKNCDTLDYLRDRIIHVLCKNICIFIFIPY